MLAKALRIAAPSAEVAELPAPFEGLDKRDERMLRVAPAPTLRDLAQLSDEELAGRGVYLGDKLCRKLLRRRNELVAFRSAHAWEDGVNAAFVVIIQRM